MQELNLKKFFLYLLIVSVSISAVIGIGVILVGDFGEMESKILSTTFIITLTSILGLACGAYLELNRGKLFPLSGIGLAVLSGILSVILVWWEAPRGEYFYKFLASTSLLAVAFSHLSLISFARLDRRFKWALSSVYIVVAALVGLLLAIIWADQMFASDFIGRVIGVLSIVVASLTIVIPIFHKLSDNLDEEGLIEAEIAKLKMRISDLEGRKAQISE